MAIEDLDSKQELGRWLLDHFESEPLPLGCIDGLQESLTPGSWQALNLQSGFSNLAGGYSPAAYRTMAGGRVELRGAIQKAAATPSGTVIAILPAAVRPKEALLLGSTANQGGVLAAVYLELKADGSLIYAGEEASITNLTLSNLGFWPGS